MYRLQLEINGETMIHVAARLQVLAEMVAQDTSLREHVDNGDFPGDTNHELHVYDMKEAPGL